MQVPINTDDSSCPVQAHGVTDYLVHFKDLWIRAMHGFLRSAGPGDVLIFAPELLSGMHSTLAPFRMPKESSLRRVIATPKPYSTRALLNPVLRKLSGWAEVLRG
jgi:hypothetical protein